MDQQASLIDDSTGQRYLGIVTSIFSISLVLFSIRIYTRVVPAYKLNASDYTSAVAVLAEVITFSLFAAAVGYGFGRHSAFVTPEDTVKILQCLFGIAVAGLWASTFARISVACLLLQFATSAAWKTILWMTIGFQIASILTTEGFALFRCRPIQAMWKEVHDAHCLSNEIVWVSGYLCTSIGIVGDLIFAIMPMFLIWRLNRSIVERCLISFC